MKGRHSVGLMNAVHMRAAASADEDRVFGEMIERSDSHSFLRSIAILASKPSFGWSIMCIFDMVRRTSTHLYLA